MPSHTPLRRSGRKRQRTKYSLDAFEGLDVLSDVTPSEEEDPDKAQDDVAADDSDLEFDDEERGSNASGNDVPDEDSQESASYLDDDDDVALPGRRKQRQSASHKTSSRRPAPSKKEPHITLSRYRVQHKMSNRGNRRERYINLFGPGREDLMAMIQAREKWINNVSLPWKHEDEHGRGGLACSPFGSSARGVAEAETTSGWFNAGGSKALFEKEQTIRTLPEAEGKTYMPCAHTTSHSCYIGPWNRQKLFSFPIAVPLSVAEAWKQADDSDPATTPTVASKGEGGGWILNAGAKVQCLSWLPSTNANVQYLALSTLGRDRSSPTAPEPPEPEVRWDKAPAFTLSPLTPAAIQIWAFQASQEDPTTADIDPTCSPRLHMVLCTDWGPVRQIKWCPTPSPEDDTNEAGHRQMGLLAGVWGDGKVRVLDVRHAEGPDLPTQYLHIIAAAFSSKPPSTLCTSLDWLSATHIATGHANGYVSIWDLSTLPMNYSSNPRPILHQPIHQTYILSLASLRPSHPSIFTTTSMDGYTRLTSLHSAHTDFTTSPRTRMGALPLAWSDHTQLVLAAEEHQGLRALPVRRFFSTINVARPAASITALATAATHTSVLVATADGTVLVTNPLRKLIHPKSDLYQQTWFRCEWSRARADANGMGDDGNNGDAQRSAPEPSHPLIDVQSGGVSRMTEGYHVTVKSQKKAERGEGYGVLYEEPTSVTAVAWNPNVACGAWAAAGMGSGLVRVEDLGVVREGQG
ncbi:MAG: hypothetical protein M1833_006425 [Piccolia ochrophora]|nr:MAG: hypothetical protein M1833_006425 [Piccolia ochrophora]